MGTGTSSDLNSSNTTGKNTKDSTEVTSGTDTKSAVQLSDPVTAHAMLVKAMQD
jgi:hypothetical protein